MTRPGDFEVYQSSKSSAAEITAGRLADKARRLLEQSMKDTAGGKKHKWATGREKWEALQREGQIAAGLLEPGRGRGRPKKQPPTAMELIDDFMTRLINHEGYKANYTDDQLEGDREDLVARREACEAAGAMTEEIRAASVVIIGR